MSIEAAPRHAPYAVASPRASDAIGMALRDAYCRDAGLPEDIAMLVRRLNGNGGMRSRG